jgi:hypothetical protein
MINILWRLYLLLAAILAVWIGGVLSFLSYWRSVPLLFSLALLFVLGYVSSAALVIVKEIRRLKRENQGKGDGKGGRR